jgi:hypothetical protein
MAKQARKDGALEVVAQIEPNEGGALPSGEVVAYAFSDGGRLLDAKPLKDGRTRLSVPIGAEAAAARLLIGPRVPDDVPLVAELLRRGSVEAHVRLDPKAKLVHEVQILPHDWICWFLSRCTVPGTLLKRTVRDGITVDLPVCNADVEVYEVDPLVILIPRLPDDILDRIKDHIIRQPIPHPDPDPGPLVPPHGPGPDPAPILHTAHAEHALPALGPAAATISPDLRSAVQLAGSHDALRQVLLANPLIVRPLICLLFPHFVTKTLLGTAHTDECGHFRLTFFRGCRNPDQPDLWFKASQQWYFGRLTIYNPTPIACHTWWNYRCGTEVTLYTTHPLAMTCPPCAPISAPDNYVMVWGVGRHSAHAIHGASADLPLAPRGQTADGRPFGGLLRLRLDFDSGLRNDLGVMYYRVSWRNAAGGTFQPLLGECHRHYRVEADTGPTFVGFPLGPKVVPDPGGTAGLFEIPPSYPPTGFWTVADPVEDTTNAKFPSDVLVPGVAADQPDNAGVHELKIELFDAAGQPVDAAALGIAWVVPDTDNLATDGVINGEAPAAGAVVGGAFILPLHVDNNHCEAVLGAPTLQGVPADDCGVIRYGSGEVLMPYHAAHRNGFATRSFAVKRGAGPALPPSESGPVTGGEFVASGQEADLREGCAIAAFAETLTVTALATDGWSGHLSNLDASDVRAFTLAPTE